MKPSHFYSPLIPVFILFSLVLISACKKDYSPSSSSQDPTKTLLMKATNDIFMEGNEENVDMADVVASDNKETGNSTPDCRIITFNPSKDVYPHQKTIDFGAGCKGNDGIIRKGKKIITVYTNPSAALAGTLISKITFNNFYVDGVNIKGDVKSYVETPSNHGSRAMKVVVNEKLNSSNGDSKTFTATHYWEQTAGGSSPRHQDDIFKITGNAEGNEILDGVTSIQWTSKIDALHPVIKSGGCNYRTKGVMNIQLYITTGGKSTFTECLDYGDGACDNKATLSINGGTPQEVTLPLLFWPLSL